MKTSVAAGHATWVMHKFKINERSSFMKRFYLLGGGADF